MYQYTASLFIARALEKPVMRIFYGDNELGLNSGLRSFNLTTFMLRYVQQIIWADIIQALNAMIEESHRNFLHKKDNQNIRDSSPCIKLYKLVQSSFNISHSTYLKYIQQILDQYQRNIKQKQVQNTLIDIQNNNYIIKNNRRPFQENRCSLTYFLYALGQKQPQHSIEEIYLHKKLINFFGVIYKKEDVEYFQRYFEKLKLQKYTLEFIETIINFILVLPHAIQILFKDRFARQLNKQQNAIKNIFELQIRNSKSSQLQKQSLDAPFLSSLFHLFYELEHNTEAITRFINDLSFEQIFSHVKQYKQNLSVKAPLILFMNCHVRKLIRFLQIKKKYIQQNNILSQKDPDNQRIIQWITVTNDFIQQQNQIISRSITFQKQCINYYKILIELIQLRDKIIKNFKQMSHYSLFPTKMFTEFSSHDSQSNPMMNIQSSKSDHRSFQTELQKAVNYNKLIVFELVQKIDRLVSQEELDEKMSQKLIWLESEYGIHFEKIALNLVEIQKEKHLYYCKNYESLGKNNQNNIKNYQLNGTSNYRVLILQLLEKNIAPKIDFQISQNTIFISDPEEQYEVIEFLAGIDFCLQQEIQTYLQKTKVVYKEQYDALPIRYQKMSQLDDKLNNKPQLEKLKCCQLEKFYIETLFLLLLRCFLVHKHQLVTCLHKILIKIICYNDKNRSILTQCLSQNYLIYFKVLNSYTTLFKQCSPIVKQNNFILYDMMTSQRSYIFDESIILTPPSQKLRLIDKYSNFILETQVSTGYQQIQNNFSCAVDFMFAMAASIDQQFKNLISLPTIKHQSILFELLSTLQIFSQNLSLITKSKMKCLKQLIEVILMLIRGPFRANINICLKMKYPKTIERLLTYQYNQKQIQDLKLKGQLTKIKKILAETLYILIPFLKDNYTDLVEHQLEQAYVLSRKTYSSNYADVIIDYSKPSKSEEISVLYFCLALHLFYCLFELYRINNNSTIIKIQHSLYMEQEMKKKHLKKWKVLYQIYRVLADIFYSIYHRLSSTYEDYTLDRSHDELLERAISFFSKHVASLQIKVDSQIQKVYFLKLKEAQCLTPSIRKQLRRLTRFEERTLRLTNLMAVSKYITMRLEIQRSVLELLERFKPIELLIRNKQLWKNINFGLVIVLNYFYIFEVQINKSLEIQVQDVVVNFTLSLIYLMLIFIFLSYILEVIPLKLKLYRLINRQKFKLLSLFVFFNDKTLFYCLSFFIVVSISFINLAWISILTLDFFFRFKTSNKITSLLFRISSRIIYIVLFIFSLLFVSTLIEMAVNLDPQGCLTPSACTQQNFSIIMRLQYNLFQLVQNIEVWRIFAYSLRFFTHIIITGLIIGLIITEKIADNRDFQERQFLKKSRCYICHKTRNQIEKEKNCKEGFQLHIETEHNLWNYLYYLIYLKNKQNEKLSSVEQVILQKWMNNHIDWLPG